MQHQFRTILFDADETLFDFIKSEQEAFYRSFLEVGIAINSDQLLIYREINEQLWLDYAQGRVSLESLRVERFARFLKILGVDIDPVVFSKRYIHFLGEGAYLLPGSEDVCRQLVERGYRIAIITNGIKEVQRSRIERSGLKSLLAGLFISEEIGFQKPDKRFFEHTLAALQIEDRSECLIVGDSLQADILGGINANMATCWFNPMHKSNDTAIEPTYQIDRIEQIFELIQKP